MTGDTPVLCMYVCVSLQHKFIWTKNTLMIHVYVSHIYVHIHAQYIMNKHIYTCRVSVPLTFMPRLSTISLMLFSPLSMKLLPITTVLLKTAATMSFRYWTSSVLL